MTSKGESSVWKITIATVLTGGLVGVLGGVFLKTLALAEATRASLVETPLSHGIPGWLAATATSLLGAAASV